MVPILKCQYFLPDPSFVLCSELGLRDARSIPQIDARADRYRDRMIDLLNEQKRILDEFTKTDSKYSKNWKALGREEEALIERYNEFGSEYSEWLPGSLKEHDYELHESKDR